MKIVKANSVQISDIWDHNSAEIRTCCNCLKSELVWILALQCRYKMSMQAKNRKLQ